MSSPVVGIQPSVLRWARVSQGYSIDEVALHLKRDSSEVASWESGSSAPSYAQLEELAYKLYRRPLAVFFLPDPPGEPDPKREFRTLPDFELDHLAADTRYQVRLARALQLSLKELNDGVNPTERIIFRESPIHSNEDTNVAASKIRKFLGVPLSVQFSWKSDEEALDSWRVAIEEAGIYVFKHAFKQKEISGLCLLDDEFPIIYLNNSTAKTRQIFSLFHELAHLLQRVNAISMFDESYIDHLPRREKRIEQLCNAFAAEFLVPTDDFARRAGSPKRINDAFIADLAGHYHVSREVVLRRLLDRGMVDHDFYEAKVERWAKAPRRETTGGNYYATQVAYLGTKYLRLVFGKYYQGKLSLEQVAEHLGVRSGSVAGLETRMLQKAGAK